MNMAKVLGHLDPQSLWNHFEEICNIPHPSEKEEKLAQYIVSVARRNNLEQARDGGGNVLIRKPAAPGKGDLPPVVLQGHLDMVAEKNGDVVHDFDRDPLQPYVEGDWVKARGTTLGGDNGIGAAAALAVMESKDVAHGPLEALFTLQEETGMFGARALKPGFIQARILINLDSEEDGALYIGCAGGQDTHVTFRLNRNEVPARTAAFEIRVSGLKGGHSGLEIHAGRGNAIKVMARLLHNLSERFGIRLVSLDGGSKHNAIPRECDAVIRVGQKVAPEAIAFIEGYQRTVKMEFASVEPAVDIFAAEVKSTSRVMDKTAAQQIIDSLYTIQNGVIKMNADMKELVETSSNLAVVVTRDNAVDVVLSQRSSVESERVDLAHAIAAHFKLVKAEVKQMDGYPGWKPDLRSPILSVMKNTYQLLDGHEPRVKAVHAGLECGLIKAAYPQMDMISFGPTIMGAHSPEERVQISSVEKFWKVLIHALENIPSN
jgi:dipeptidase D